MKSLRSMHLLLLVALVGLLTVAFPGFSSASFTARTQAVASVRAASTGPLRLSRS